MRPSSCKADVSHQAPLHPWAASVALKLVEAWINNPDLMRPIKQSYQSMLEVFLLADAKRDPA